MKIIYEPKGPAKEYADLGLNIYNGCTHRCRYCYCANKPYIDKEKYYSAPSPKKDIISRVKHDCKKLIEKHKKPENVPEILLSFQGDVYQPAEAQLGLTRFVIEILIDHGLPFTILTKGGLLVTRDFDLLIHYPKFRLGVSMSVVSTPWVKLYESGAASPHERAKSLAEAKKIGIKTWCSLEPVIDAKQAVWIIEHCKDVVDKWYVGKLKDQKFPDGVFGWGKTRDMISECLNSVEASYYIKKTLREA